MDWKKPENKATSQLTAREATPCYDQSAGSPANLTPRSAAEPSNPLLTEPEIQSTLSYLLNQGFSK